MSDNQFENQGLKKWIQDNLRIILSILVVVVIAAGINSYSKRSENSGDIAVNEETEAEIDSELSELEKQLAELDLDSEETDEETVIETEEPSEEEPIVEIEQIEEAPAEEVAPVEETQPEEQPAAEETQNEQPQQPEPTEEENTQEPAPVSEETPEALIETASRGEGLTHLARRALTDYLEKNPNSSLNAEQKIYIEDYLRKNVNHTAGVNVGTTVEFSKDLIKSSIDKATQLSDSQLNNLKKYSARVTAI